MNKINDEIKLYFSNKNFNKSELQNFPEGIKKMSMQNINIQVELSAKDHELLREVLIRIHISDFINKYNKYEKLEKLKFIK